MFCRSRSLLPTHSPMNTFSFLTCCSDSPFRSSHFLAFALALTPALDLALLRPLTHSRALLYTLTNNLPHLHYSPSPLSLSFPQSTFPPSPQPILLFLADLLDGFFERACFLAGRCRAAAGSQRGRALKSSLYR
eukprot:6198186-Pleurochrysis_carterae.AAC.2